MKYLLNQRQEEPRSLIFMGIELGDVTTSPTEETEVSQEAPAEKEKDFDEKSAEAMTMLKGVLENKDPVLQKRILDRFNQECGLDDGVISAGDNISGADKGPIPAQLPKEMIPYDHSLDGDSDITSLPPIPRAPLSIDGKIDQSEYHAFVKEFTDQIGVMTTDINNDPLYKEDIDGLKNMPSVSTLLSDFPVEIQEAVFEKMMSEINDPSVFTEYKTAEGLMTVDGLQKYITDASVNKDKYQELISATEKLNPQYREAATEVARQLKGFYPENNSFNFNYNVASDGSLEAVAYYEGADWAAIDPDVLTVAKQESMGISKEELPALIKYLYSNRDLITSIAKNTVLRADVIDLTQTSGQNQFLNLAARNIKSMEGRVGGNSTLYNGDYFRGAFTENLDGGVSVDLLDKKDINYTLFSGSDLKSFGLSNAAAETFLTKNISKLQGRLSRNEISEEGSLSKAEYPNDPSIERNQKGTTLAKEKEAAKIAETQALADAKAAKEAAREQARSSANESFIATVTNKDYAALGIALNGSETLDEKITTIQEKLIEKGQAVSSNGTADKWAGPRTIAALKNIRTEYTQKTEKQKPQTSGEKEEQTANANKETTTVAKENSPINEVAFTDENGEDCPFLLDELGDPEDFNYLENDINVKNKNLILRAPENDNIVYIKHSSSEGYNTPPENFNVKFVKRGGKWTAESGKWNTDKKGTILDIKDLENQRRTLAAEKEAALVDAQEKMFAEQPHLGSHKS